MALGSTQPLTEMSTRNLPRGKGRPAPKADNLAVICESIVEKMCEPRRLKLCGPPRPVTGIALPYFLPYHVKYIKKFSTDEANLHGHIKLSKKCETRERTVSWSLQKLLPSL
jgi:hypothetical protein